MGVEASKISGSGGKLSVPPLKIGSKGDKGGAPQLDLSGHDPMQQSERENLSAWHREGVSVWDVYDLVEVIGQGHMGEVYKVRRKKETRGLHNTITRGRQAGKEESAAGGEEKRSKDRSRSKSPFPSKKKGGIKLGKKKKKKGSGKDAGVPPRPDPQVIPVKEPQTDATPRQGILKLPKFSEKKLDVEEDAGSDDSSVGSEEERSEDVPSPHVLAEGLEIPPPPLVDGSAADDDGDVDNAEYMKKWQERLEGAKEERAKLLEKIQAEKKVDGAAAATPPPQSEDSSLDGSRHQAESPMSPSTPRGGGKKKIRFQRQYACKTVLTSHVKKGFVDQLLNEISIMKNLDHPFILQLFEVYHVKRSIWLVTELCTGGDLTSRKLNEPQTTLVLEQILRALIYLHRLGICHRDIKLENILYENGGKEASIRLIDFGLSQAFDRSAETKRRAVGTAYTMSPEIASGEGEYTRKTDMWALGVVAWILLAGDAPFVKEADDLKDKDKLNRLLNARYTFGITWQGRGISEYGKDFVRRCLKRQPGDRWTAKEALDYVQGTWIPKLEGDYEGKEAALKLQRSISARRRSGEGADINVEDVNKFCNYGRLKKTILMTMARTMERSEVDTLREIFLTADTEDTGTIGIVQLKKSLRQLNSSMNEKDIEKIFEGIDQDQSGRIHWAEFLAALSESHGLITMDRLATAFDRLDTEGKGYISHENLKVILGKDYDKEIVESMIKEADFKNNGQIDYEEFLQLMFANPEGGAAAVGRIDDSKTTLESITGKKTR